VPFCATRCGYCDFNTYTAGELGGATGPDAYLEAALVEIRLARRSMPDAPAVSTVFFGGGTPTLLPPASLGALLGQIRSEFGLAPDAEVTTEANPETVDARMLDDLRRSGFTRISIGMQSSSPSVLAVLDRVHTPGSSVNAARLARVAGFDEVSLDLIYGTPGESDASWRGSLEAALSAQPTHVSAYALIVENGTALSRKVRGGEIPAPDDDVLADRYEIADELLSAAGLPWYEISNWGSPCRHNLAYWRSENWWGIGPGAHSHVGGVRWWNVRHPAAYAEALRDGRTPAQAREILDETSRTDERVLLAIRLAEGLPLAAIPGDPAVAARRVRSLATDGLADEQAAGGTEESVRLTLRGRLLADTVVHRLLA
jgi:oxygen-independent coproporphyrinogen-3 oxidase